MTENYFGEHLMLDGYGADPKLLFDKELISTSLSELCTRLGVLQLAEPQVISIPDGELKVPGGVTGMVILAESHISIHTFPARRFISADVYSCRHDMDTKLVAEYLSEKFHIQEIEMNFVKRGFKYPSEDIAY